jgi:hypothetical protein
VTATAVSFPLSKHTGGGDATPALSGPACLFTAYMGGAHSPLSSRVFLLPPLLQAFPLLVAGRGPPLLPSQASPSIHSSVRDCPSLPLQPSGRPALFTTCLFLLLFIIQFGFFLFFAWVGVSLSRGLF